MASKKSFSMLLDLVLPLAYAATPHGFIQGGERRLERLRREDQGRGLLLNGERERGYPNSCRTEGQRALTPAFANR